MLIHWIWLASLTGSSDRTKAALLSRLGDAEDVFHADRAALERMEGLDRQTLEALDNKDLDQAHKILVQCENKAIKICTQADKDYPAKLKSIPDPPPVLYYKGHLPDLSQRPAIGVVGTRKATAYGLGVASRLGGQIARCGGVVVSGMARGIDAMAMTGALQAEGCVIGVLGCGADVVYPASNRELFREMERWGCLISEFAPGTPPSKWNFPRRNRIISGLSDGVLVVEAPSKSGALITARLAADQGRDVFAVPGNIGVAECAGSNELLRDGAIMVSTGWDILSEYQAVYPETVVRYKGPEPPVYHEPQTPKVAGSDKICQPEPASSGSKEKKVIDNRDDGPYIDGEMINISLTPEERSIVERLKDGPCLADDLIVATGLPAGTFLSVVTMLQVKGMVRRLPGNMLSL